MQNIKYEITNYNLEEIRDLIWIESQKFDGVFSLFESKNDISLDVIKKACDSLNNDNKDHLKNLEMIMYFFY